MICPRWIRIEALGAKTLSTLRCVLEVTEVNVRIIEDVIDVVRSIVVYKCGVAADCVACGDEAEAFVGEVEDLTCVMIQPLPRQVPFRKSFQARIVLEGIFEPFFGFVVRRK